MSGYSNEIPYIDVDSLPFTTFLPSLNDCKKLCDNYIILASRVLVRHLAFLAPLIGCVPQHIEHAHLNELTKKSDIVSYTSSACALYQRYILVMFCLFCIGAGGGHSKCEGGSHRNP